MNDTATALGNQTNSIFSNTSPGVVIVLALVALFAAVTIAGLVYGAHQKRRRVRAEAEVVQHADEEREATGGTAPLAEAEASSAEAVAPAPAPPPAAAPEPEAPDPTPLADEPIAATDAATANPAAEAEAGAEPESAVLTEAAASPAPEPALADAPVTILKGLGPKVAARLNELGVATVADLAALDDRAAQDLDARLGAFIGRMTRDRWLEQARLLAADDRKGFEERFGKL